MKNIEHFKKWKSAVDYQSDCEKVTLFDKRKKSLGTFSASKFTLEQFVFYKRKAHKF